MNSGLEGSQAGTALELCLLGEAIQVKVQLGLEKIRYSFV